MDSHTLGMIILALLASSTSSIAFALYLFERRRQRKQDSNRDRLLKFARWDARSSSGRRSGRRRTAFAMRSWHNSARDIGTPPDRVISMTTSSNG